MSFEIIEGNTFWNGVALVKFKNVTKHILVEPNTAEGVQQSFVKVICDTTPVLHLTKHVPHSCPRHTLELRKGTIAHLF